MTQVKEEAELLKVGLDTYSQLWWSNRRLVFQEFLTYGRQLGPKEPKPTVTPPTLKAFRRQAKAHLSRPVHWPGVQPCVSVSYQGTGQTQHTGESPGDSLLSIICSQEVNPIHSEAPRHTNVNVFSASNDVTNKHARLSLRQV